MSIKKPEIRAKKYVKLLDMPPGLGIVNGESICEKRRPGGFEMSKVKVAVVGAGNLANMAHYPSLTSFDDVEIVGICDLNEERLHATAEKFGISQTFSDYRVMLDTVKPDAAYAILPPHILFDVAMDILERNIHLFIEKPVCNTRIQAESLSLIAEKNNLVTAVGFQRRYHPAFVKCREAVTAHGRLRQVVSTFYKCLSGTYSVYCRGGIDVLSCDAVHAVDALRYFAGGEVVKVSSEIKRLGTATYDNFHVALVEFDNGVTGVLLTNWYSGKRLLAMEFHAEGALALADADGVSEISVNNKITQTFTNAEAANSGDMIDVQGHRAENRAFIDGVKSDRSPHNNITDALKTWDLVEQIYYGANFS